jgi:2-oxoglutarate dehydrogenase E1 component
VLLTSNRRNVSGNILDSFRRWGYFQADLDPLHFLKPEPLPELDFDGEEAAAGRGYYCGTIGVEFMQIPDRLRREWIQERMERARERSDARRILDLLVRTETFELMIQSRFPGTKRFSIEGAASLVPLLDEILDAASEQGATEAVIGMSHRGRLNVMVHIVGRSPEEVFTQFEDVDPQSVLGGGDVKYHIGATGQHTTPNKRSIQVRLVSNPSHLEAVDPVALGRVRAKQSRLGDGGTTKVLPILIHGDAAFAGQGIVAETLNFAGMDGYSVGGVLHIIVNNRIGFTADPSELHSSRFASDVARRLSIPIFHVNAEDPDAVAQVGRLALGYRTTFGDSVVVDLVGFRRHGHSELDDPTITQPKLYQAIKSHPPLWKIYSEKLGIDAQPGVDAALAAYGAAQDQSATASEIPQITTLPEYWDGYRGGSSTEADYPETLVEGQELLEVTRRLTSVPAGFALHPKVSTVLEKRRQMANGKIPVDFGFAEQLAFGTLLRQKVPVRLSGQDSSRGTFGQRHAVLVDVETEARYTPLSHIGEKQGRFETYNSPLSEAAILGFEYGYSRDAPETLVLWEAQYGDFANGAQLIIDQFISAAEDKWGLLSGLVLLLPHGYEGQGPEHSSARIERFLQLAAEDNIQICQSTTAAQYFHLLRQQALRRWRKPLIVFTPKSMLRLSAAGSPMDEFSSGRFLPVITEADPRGMSRVIVCTGKIVHELRKARQELNDTAVGIVSLEQIYPFPEEQLRESLDSFADAQEIVLVQEEPANMGAFTFLLPRLMDLAGGRPVRSVKRSASASPATGSAKAHAIEQKTLLSLAFHSGGQGQSTPDRTIE